MHSTFYFIIIFFVALVVSEAVHPNPSTGSLSDLILGLLVLSGPLLIGLAWAAIRQRRRLAAALPTPQGA